VREKDTQKGTIHYLEEQLKEKIVENEIYKELVTKQQEELDGVANKKEVQNMRVSHSALFKINTSNENVPKCTECIIY
jgi:hypothetical protein